MLIEFKQNGDFTKEKASPQEVSLLGIIRNLASRFRAGIIALGIAGLGGANCAHRQPIRVPNSQTQAERKICFVSTILPNGVYSTIGAPTFEGISETIRPIFYRDLRQYLTERYSNITHQDLGGFTAQNVRFQRKDEFKGNWFVIDFPEKVQEQLPHFIEEACDDVIVMSIVASIRRKVHFRDYSQHLRLFDWIMFAAEADVLNVEMGTVDNIKESIEDVRIKGIGIDTSDEYERIDTAELIAELRDKFKDFFSNSLLKNYHPHFLPPLSLARREKYYIDSVNRIYSKYEKTDTPLADIDARELKRLGNSFMSQFPESSNVETIRRILNDIDERITRLQEKQFRQAEKKRLALEKVQNGEAVRELQSLIARAQAAEKVGNYEAAYVLFDKARQAGWRVSDLYKDAGIMIPYSIDSLSYEIERGYATSKSLLGISQPKPYHDPSSPVAALEEGFRALRDTAIALAPTIGAMAVKAAEISAQLHEELARQGFTADLEIRMIRPGLLMDKPIQNVEITVASKNPPYSSETFRTTKEGIMEQGGRAKFYLRPGHYEISSPILDRKYEITVREGRNDLTVELR